MSEQNGAPAKPLSRNEHLKEASAYLRGTVSEGLRAALTGAISEDDQQLVKFHGMYLQDDRDLRGERARKKMEKAFGFMIRVRIPGGILTPAQYLAIDGIGKDYASGSLRITTRQTIQLHGIIKTNLVASMRDINAALMTTIAACGDVNRNVMCNPNPHQSRAHAQAMAAANAVSDHLLPQTPAYREIWLDGERIVGDDDRDIVEPLYGKTYLPRKFKVGFAVPPSNDIDVFANDLGFIAIVDKAGDIAGYNVAIGGGMGMTHGEPETWPRIGDVLGYCKAADVVAVAEAVMTVQRDWGDRANRKHARLKYTLEDRGLDVWREEVGRRAAAPLAKAKPYRFTSTGDRYGWVESEDGHGHLTLFVENGRIKDVPGAQRMTGLRRIAQIHTGTIHLTGNQNIIIANVAPEARAAIEALVQEHGLLESASALRRNAMACVALPTCGLALAESERFLPGLVTALEESLARHGLDKAEIVVRMTGCPNGCARPYLAEIGFVGKGPGRYNVYLGAAFDGSRMNRLFAEDVKDDAIIGLLDSLFAAYAKDRKAGEHFGDFTVRAGYVEMPGNGPAFHG